MNVAIVVAGLVLAAQKTPKAPAQKSPATLAGVKGAIAYTTKTEPISDLAGASLFTIDLAEVLDPPDPDLGNRRPLALNAPSFTAWLPGESRPRAKQRLYPTEDAGQYEAHLRFSGIGFGSVRIDATTDKGAFAVMLPVVFGAATGRAGEVKILPPSPGEAKSGDAALGKALYEKRCACCHDGKGAARFDNAEFSWAKNDADYRRATLLDRLRVEDVIAYLAPLRPPLGKIAPDAERYVARNGVCDPDQVKKIGRLLNHTPSTDAVALIALYRGTPPLQRLGNDARALTEATSDRRLGYVAVVRGGPHEPAPELWLRLDNDWRIQRVLARNGHGQSLAGAPTLDAFTHQGGRDESAVPALARVQQHDPWAVQISTAYLLATCAADDYEGEEANRSWAK